MSLIVKTPKRKFELAPEGNHAAKIVEIKDLGPVETRFGVKEKVLIVWEIDGLDRQGKRCRVFQRFTSTWHAKAALRKAVRCITGADPGGEEFDLHALVGRTAELLIQHHEAGGSVYANVAAILRPKTVGEST